MAGHTVPRPTDEPAPEYQAVLNELRALATAPPSDSPEENAARLYGLWVVMDAARDILRSAMATVNHPGPGRLSYRDQGAILNRHRSTAQQEIQAGKRLLGDSSDD